jgi:hypothetical protein
MSLNRPISGIFHLLPSFPFLFLLHAFMKIERDPNYITTTSMQ